MTCFLDQRVSSSAFCPPQVTQFHTPPHAVQPRSLDTRTQGSGGHPPAGSLSTGWVGSWQVLSIPCSPRSLTVCTHCLFLPSTPTTTPQSALAEVAGCQAHCTHVCSVLFNLWAVDTS